MKKVVLLAVTVIAFALAVAPVSFAGEDDPGPTQSGEVLGQSVTPTKATSTPTAAKKKSSSSSTKAKSTASHSSDTVRAKGGVQTGLGGAFATSGSNVVLSLGLGTGAVFLLAAAAGVAPIRRRAQR